MFTIYFDLTISVNISLIIYCFLVCTLCGLKGHWRADQMCPPELVALKSIQDRLDAELASGVRREDVISNLVGEYQQLNMSFPQTDFPARVSSVEVDPGSARC